MAAVADAAGTCLLTEKWLTLRALFPGSVFYRHALSLHSLHLNVLTAQGRSDLFLRLEIIKKTADARRRWR